MVSTFEMKEKKKWNKEDLHFQPSDIKIYKVITKGRTDNLIKSPYPNIPRAGCG